MRQGMSRRCQLLLGQCCGPTFPPLRAAASGKSEFPDPILGSARREEKAATLRRWGPGMSEGQGQPRGVPKESTEIKTKEKN